MNRKQLYAQFNHLYKLYCPLDDLRYICFYCGLPAGTVDHVPPLNRVTELKVSQHEVRYLKVPSCSECNLLATDELHDDIFIRQEFVKNKIKNKYKKYLRYPDWDDDEIDALGYRLKQSVMALMELKYLIVYRLQYGLGAEFKVSDLGYLDFDPRKIVKFANPAKWDETMETVWKEEESLKNTNELLADVAIKRSRHNEGYSFFKAKEVCRDLNIKNSGHYQKWRRENPKDPSREYLPASPSTCFESLWRGWPDFLAESYQSGNSVLDPNNFISDYEEAKKFIHSYELKNSIEFSEVRRNDSIVRLRIPSGPKEYFAEAWKGWPDFLGKSYISKINVQTKLYLSYIQARDFLSKYKFKKVNDFVEERKVNIEMKKVIPSSPKDFYKEDWVSYEDFFGAEWGKKK